MSVIILLCGCTAGPPQEGTPPPGQGAGDLRSLVASAPVIVVGTVQEVRPGRTVPGPEPTRFDEVRLSVERALKGDPGSSVVVEQLAGAVVPGMPAMRPGERYLLLVRPQMDAGPGRYVILRQGRLQLVQGRVRAITPGPVADQVRGMSEAQLIDQVVQAMRG